MEELKVKVVEVSQEKEQPQGNDYIRVTVEIDGRKIAVWTTESNTIMDKIENYYAPKLKAYYTAL